MLRIYYAIKDINNGSSITHTSINNGFNSLEYFSETFKHVMGVNPSTYLNFIHYRYAKNDEQIETINERIINLMSLIDKKTKYLNNVKPDILPRKALTIFK